jgi:fatty-acyl-CoA synthase
METIFYGASPMSPAKLTQAIEDWGPIFFQFYGQTEAPMVITHLKKGEHDLTRPDRLSSCGRPVPWMHVALLDTDNRPVAAGESGEICTRGPLVMTGYKDLPDETAEALSGDWLHTGDVGRFDDDGYLYIVDRTKDMVITGGFNVYSAEVEQALMAHEAVRDCAVIGLPDEKWGERVTAVVELQPGSAVSGDDLAAFVKARLGSVKAPKQIEFWDSLPRSTVGKVLKTDVRAALTGS